MAETLFGIFHTAYERAGDYFYKAVNSKYINTFIVESNYKGGKLKIAHVNNLDFALKIKEAIKEKFEEAKIFISECRGLCSYYAEEGGVLIGCECF